MDVFNDTLSHTIPYLLVAISTSVNKYNGQHPATIAKRHVHFNVTSSFLQRLGGTCPCVKQDFSGAQEHSWPDALSYTTVT